MPRRLIDISVPLKAGIASDPPHMLPTIEYLDHHQTAPAMAEYMGVRVDQLRFGAATPFETVLEYRPSKGVRALSHEVVAVLQPGMADGAVPAVVDQPDLEVRSTPVHAAD